MERHLKIRSEQLSDNTQTDSTPVKAAELNQTYFYISALK